METYIHSIPGRLRLRDQQLKADPAATDDLQRELRELPGITSVDFHPASSSLVVHYDPNTHAPEQMLFAMRAHGYLHGDFKTNLQPAASEAGKQSMRGKLGTLLVRNVSRAAVRSVAGYALEAAIIRLVPAAALPLLLLPLARKVRTGISA
jgi:cation transport ATPase